MTTQSKKKAATKKTDNPVVEVAPLVAYKGFDKDWKCRDFQYEVGKTYTHNGTVRLCISGFHACESPLDIWGYYPPTDGSNYAQVDLNGATEETENDTKRVGSSVTIKAALTIPMLIAAQIEWTFNKAKDENKSSGDSSTAASSGDYSKAASSGNYSTAASSGDSSTAASSGNSSKAASSGDYSTAEAKGEKTIAMVAGCRGKARAGEKGAFSLAWFDRTSDRMRIAVGTIGENGIKPDVWYCCDDSGQLIEA